jgi:hypothetical protein
VIGFFHPEMNQRAVIPKLLLSKQMLQRARNDSPEAVARRLTANALDVRYLNAASMPVNLRLAGITACFDV